MNLKEHEEAERLLASLARGHLPLRAWRGTGYRFTSLQYSDPAELLSGRGAWKFGSRWIPRAVATTVHASSTPQLAFAESLARFRRANVPEWQAMPLAVCGILVELTAVLDLTHGRARQGLRVSLERMLGVDWQAENRAGREALSQAVGRAVFDAGHAEGLLVPSSTGERGHNLVIFMARLRTGSVLEVRHGSA